MKNNVLDLLEDYKSRRVLDTGHINWLKGLLPQEYIEELEKLIEYILLETEEQAFINGFIAAKI